MDGWMDDLQLYVLLKSISVISGRRADDNERLCTMEPRLLLRGFGQHGTARSVDQHLTQRPAGAPSLVNRVSFCLGVRVKPNSSSKTSFAVLSILSSFACKLLLLPFFPLTVKNRLPQLTHVDIVIVAEEIFRGVGWQSFWDTNPSVSFG